MLSRILIPLDGSAAAAEVLGAVRYLVGGTGAVVHLLLLCPPVRGPLRRGAEVVYLDELVREEEAAGRDYLMREGSQLAFDGVVVRPLVRFGDPLVETLAAASRQAVQLIAVAAPAQALVARLLRPSLADRLRRATRVPLLTVRPARTDADAVAWRYGSVPI
jgi:nucleotide-binding universal stress UspA family protein